MKNNSHAPLKNQYIIAWLFSTLMLVCFSTAFQYFNDKQNQQAEFINKHRNYFQLIYTALSEPLIAQNTDTVAALTQQFIDIDHQISQILITDADGNPVSDWQNGLIFDSQTNTSFSNTLNHQGQLINHITISWANSQLPNANGLYKNIIVQQLIIFCCLIIQALIIFLLINRSLLKPIKLINQKISNINEKTSVELSALSNESLEISQLNQNISSLSISYKKLLLTEKVLNNAKQQIENINRRNSNILNAAGEGIFVINKKGVIIFMNSAGADRSDWEAKEITGMHFNCLMPKTHLNAEGIKDASNPVFSSSEEKHINNTLKKAKTHHVTQAFFIKKSGDSFPVQYISTPLKTDSNEIAGAVITFNDISERIQAEEKSKESQALKQAMLESSHDAIITTDEGGLICEFNKEAELMFGYSTENILSKRLENLIIPKRYRKQGQDFFLAAVDKAESNPSKRKKLELSALRKSGKEFPVELVVAPIKLNKKLFYTSFISDITERKQVKEAMENARNNAENANIAKSQFLATMSHEIRTPLSALVGVQDLLMSTELSEEQNDYINIAQQSAQTLQDVINDILDFSKIEAGKLILEFQQTDPMELVDSVLSVMASKALEKNIELLCSADYPIPKTVLLDPVRTKQILFNLVGNAIKFTHDGWIRVNLSVSKVADKDFILFEVIDTGIGISKESLASLFDEFTQADLSTTRKYGGTGLGLAISSRLIQMSNGEIHVASEQGKGSNFSFTIGPVSPPFYQPKLIPYLYCWIIKSELQSSQILYEQLKKLVSGVSLIDSINQIKSYNMSNIIFIDNKQLQKLTPSQCQNALARLHTSETVLIADFNQRKLAPEWQQIIDTQITRPILFSKIMQCLQKYNKENIQTVSEHRSLVETFSEKPQLDNQLILLAEDSELIQRVTKNMLKKLNCKVHLADNGLIALQKVKQQRYDLILMDLSMPEMGGLETTQTIRKEPGINQDTPIIALTANAFKDDFKECKKIGMNGFLTKPLTFDQLQAELFRIFDKNTAPPEIEFQENDKPSTKFDEQHLHTALIDYDVINRLKEEMSEQLFPKMIDLFIEQGEVRVNKIEIAIKENDFKTLASEIHTLKSESTTFGAIELGELSTHINTLCHENRQQEAIIAAGQTKSCWQNTIMALKKNLVT